MASIIISLFCSNTFSFDTSTYKPPALTEDSSVVDIAGKVIGLVQAVGNIVSILALIVIGIKYMMGSIEEKAEFKNTAIYYVIGAILVFAISNISAIIYNFANTL